MVPALLITTLVALNAPVGVDVHASTELRLFRREWATSAVSEDPSLRALLHSVARTRVIGIDSPWETDALSAELAVWADTGALAEPVVAGADGDVQSAWVQHQTPSTRLRIGRQLTTAAAARYSRFDGITAGVTKSRVQLEGYAGFVVQPRWNQPRGYFLLGDDTSVLRVPELAHEVARAERWLGGASLLLIPIDRLHTGLSVHEEHHDGAVARRRVAADARYDVGARLSSGGRVILDTTRGAIVDAQAYADVVLADALVSALDYTYQAPELMFLGTSIFSVFDTDAWHELGAELDYTGVAQVRLSARGSAQLYEEGTPGARGSLRAVLTPESGYRWRVVLEAQRLVAAARGYVLSRGAFAFRPDELWTMTADLALYLYDHEVNGLHSSTVALGSLERALGSGLAASLAGSVASTPYAKHELQVMARLSLALDHRDEP